MARAQAARPALAAPSDALADVRLWPLGRSQGVGGEFLRLPESLRILKSDKHEKMDQAGCTMRVAFLLFVHLLVNVAKLVGPGGSKGLLAETLLVKHQLIVLNRSRRRAPNLTTWDRFLFGLTGFFMTPARIAKNTVVVSTATLFRFTKPL